MLEGLLTASSTKQYNELWASFPNLESLLRRVSVPILDQPLRAAGFIASFLKINFRVTGEATENVKGLILEKWFEVLERGLHIPEIAQAAMEVSGAVLGMFKADDMPIRRTR